VSARLHNSHLSVCSAQSSWKIKRIRRHRVHRIISWAIRSYALALFSTGFYLYVDEMQKSVRAFIMRFPAVAIFSLADAAL
jgi:hypothetical protein